MAFITWQAGHGVKGLSPFSEVAGNANAHVRSLTDINDIVAIVQEIDPALPVISQDGERNWVGDAVDQTIMHQRGA